MSDLLSTNEHTLLLCTVPELEEAFRNVLSSFLTEREEKKKEALLTRKAVSERLNVDNSTLWRWDKANYLKPIRVGKAVYYKESDVIDIEEGRI